MRAQIISFNCVVKNKAGQVVSTTYNSEILTLGEMEPGGVLYGLNKNLQNLSKGEKRSITVSAEEAYGLYDPAKVILFPRRKLPNVIRKGELINIVGKSGTQRSYRIVEFNRDFASLDGNHPLAGQDLIFEIETLEAREATRKEIDESINTVTTQMWH